MKINIDEKVCIKHKLTPSELLIALAIRSANNFEEIVNNMVNREILVNHEGKFLVTQHWNEVVDEILCDSSDNVELDEQRLLNLAIKMRECFPAGKMPGTAYYYRCNNSEVIKKLKKFFVMPGNQNYTDEEIINATKRFVASFKGNYRYLPLIKYFISKLKPVQEEDGTIHNVEFSPLADYLENREDEGGVVVSTSDDWMLTSRN